MECLIVCFFFLLKQNNSLYVEIVKWTLFSYRLPIRFIRYQKKKENKTNQKYKWDLFLWFSIFFANRDYIRYNIFLFFFYPFPLDVCVCCFYGYFCIKIDTSFRFLCVIRTIWIETNRSGLFRFVYSKFLFVYVFFFFFVSLSYC